MTQSIILKKSQMDGALKWKYDLSIKRTVYTQETCEPYVIITFGSLCWRFSLAPNNSSSPERRTSDSESSRFSLLIFRYRTLTLFKWLGSTVWPLRLLRLMRKLSVTQNISALIKNGMISITTTTSTFGFVTGERMKSRTSSQKSNWISTVMQIFTMTISNT